GVACGLGAMAAASAAPGAPPSMPAELPAGEPFRSGGAGTVVLVAHPMCPCTRASLHVLERIVHEASGVDVVVLFAAAVKDRVGADLRKVALQIPGVRVVDDPGGHIAARLGVRTSGTVAFYDGTGRLRFAGGITPGRGHEGDSAGADALRAAITRDHGSSP